MGKNDIIMSEEIGGALKRLRAFMFERVYTNSVAKAEEGKAEYMIDLLYDYYLKHPEEMSLEYRQRMEEKGEKTERTVCDFIAGMTDRYAVMKFESLTVPKTWSVL